MTKINKLQLLTVFLFTQIVSYAQTPLLHKNFEDAYLKNIDKPCFVNSNFDVIIHENIKNTKYLLDLYEGSYNVNMTIERVIDFLKKSTVVSCHRINYAFDVAPIDGTIKGEIKFQNERSYPFEYAYTGYGFLYDEEKRIIWGLGNPKILSLSDKVSEVEDTSLIKYHIDYKLIQYPNEISILDSCIRENNK